MSPELLVLRVDTREVFKKKDTCESPWNGLAPDRYLRRGLRKKVKSIQTMLIIAKSTRLGISDYLGSINCLVLLKGRIHTG